MKCICHAAVLRDEEHLDSFDLMHSSNVKAVHLLLSFAPCIFLAVEVQHLTFWKPSHDMTDISGQYF